MSVTRSYLIGWSRPVVTTAAAVLALASLISGCTVGPDYVAPTPNVPATWSSTAETRPEDPATLAIWWRQFHDPVLDGLVRDALAANPDLATARAQLREARAQRNVARADLGPTLDGSAAGSDSKSSAETGSGEIGQTYSIGFDASWEIDVFGSARRGLEAAEADMESSLESLRDVQVSLVAEVVLNYVELRTAERRLAVAEGNLASLSETYALAGWRQQAGLASEVDVAEARTELESRRADVPSLRISAAEARNRLAVLLNRAPGEIASRLNTTGKIPLTERAAAVGIPADTLRQRPDVRAAEREMAAQTARLGQAEAARYPSFTLSGSIGLEALTLGALTNGAGFWSLLASVTTPIFQSGRIDANIEVEDALLEQARMAYRTAVLTALEDVENALVALDQTGERREKLAQAVTSARVAQHLAEQRYASGLIDFLTVIDSQRTLQDLEEQYAITTGDLATAQAQLFKALGGGWSPKDNTGLPKDGI